MTMDLKTAAAAERSLESKQEAEMQETVNQRKDSLAQTGLTDVISSDDYDYDGFLQEHDPRPAEEGGYDLPTRFIKDTTPVAGFDLSTGDNLWDDNDPNGFGRSGFEDIHNGVINTEHGKPADVFGGYLKIAANGRENGLSVDELDLPMLDDDEAIRLDATASRMDLHAQREYQLTELNRAPYQYPEVPEEDMEQTDWENVDTLKAAKLIYQYNYPDESGEISDEDLVEQTVTDIAALLSNEVRMAQLLVDIKSGDMDVETAQAMQHALNMYDNLSMFDMDVLLGTAEGVVTSPLTYLSGGAGKLAYTAAGKVAAKKILGYELGNFIKSRVGRAAAAGGTAGAIEGSVWAGGEEFTRQSVGIGAGIQQGYDYDRIGTAVKWGTAGGLILGGTLGPLISVTPWDKLGPTLRRVMLNASDIKTPGLPSSQRGSIGVPPETEGVDRLIGVIKGDQYLETPDMGVPLDKDIYFSRAQRNIFGDGNGTGNWEKAYGKAPKKGRDPLDVLEKVNAWQSSADAEKNIPTFSDYEIDSIGLRGWLQEKANLGQKVSRDEVEDFVYARRPRLNIGIDADIPQGKATDIQLKGAAPTDEQLTTVAVDRMLTSNLVRNLRTEKIPLADVPEGYDKLLSQAQELGLENVTTYSDPITGDARYVLSNGQELIDQIHADTQIAIGNMRHVDKLALAKEMDENMLLRDPFRDSMRYSRYTINYDEELGLVPDNYRELRAFLPYDGMDKNAVSMDRFGRSYDELDDYLRTRVDRTTEEFSFDPAMWTETTHFPMDVNQLATARLQDAYDANGGRILFVNEMQSDMANAVIRHNPYKKVDPAKTEAALSSFYMKLSEGLPAQEELMRNALTKYESGAYKYKDLTDDFAQVETYYNKLAKGATEVGDKKAAMEYANQLKSIQRDFDEVKKAWLKDRDITPYTPMREGWRHAMMQQVFDLAAKEGYAGVAFTSTKNQLFKVENWTEEMHGGEFVQKFYTKYLPQDLAKKQNQKKYGIVNHENKKLLSDDAEAEMSLLHDEPVNVYYISGKAPSATNQRPIYSAAIGAPGAMQMMNQEESEDVQNIQ